MSPIRQRFVPFLIGALTIGCPRFNADLNPAPKKINFGAAEWDEGLLPPIRV